jgi:hypothetical protein
MMTNPNVIGARITEICTSADTEEVPDLNGYPVAIAYRNTTTELTIPVAATNFKTTDWLIINGTYFKRDGAWGRPSKSSGPHLCCGVLMDLIDAPR